MAMIKVDKMKKYNFATIEDAIDEISRGKMVIVVDDEDRENEGDFVMSAELVRSQDITFMACEGRGLICAPLSQEFATRLELDLMVKNNDSIHQTAFTVSVDIDNKSTGISSKDRALTFQRLADESAQPTDFVRPGHVFPLIARSGGVLEREGHTEASVDLCRLAGLAPVSVICEIINSDGTMARRDELFKIAENFNLKMITIKDLKEFRLNS